MQGGITTEAAGPFYHSALARSIRLTGINQTTATKPYIESARRECNNEKAAAAGFPADDAR